MPQQLKAKLRSIGSGLIHLLVPPYLTPFGESEIVEVMLTSKLQDKIEELASLIRSSRYLVAFTGAGISTESGIPDFRGPQGIWKKMSPIELSEFLADPAARKEYWRRKIESYPQMRDAQPNEGHRALARLYQAGLLQTVITQNIDGLHQKSGIPDDRVIELHGSNTYIACLDCRKRFSWEEALEQEYDDCPSCDACGGWLKPATISFGQAMPEEQTRAGFHEGGRADLLLVVGSTLQVYPAAAIPQATGDSGGKVAIVNNVPTVQDMLAQFLLFGPAGEILGALAERAISQK